MTRTNLDARGLKCPLPILKAQKLLRTMSVGDCLTVLATDDMARLDFRHLCSDVRFDLVVDDQKQGTYRFEIIVRKAGN